MSATQAAAISTLRENPDDCERKHGNDPDHGELQTHRTVAGRHQPVHRSPYCPNGTHRISRVAIAFVTPGASTNNFLWLRFVHRVKIYCR
jgi:hypothetical protein